MTELTRTDTAPTHMGRYKLLRKLARGGMAEVYVARSFGAHGFEKTVAIKRILSRFSEDPQFVRMMVDEAKISVLLTHPNIAQVLEFGEHEGTHFLVMEYVPGQSLAALQKKVKAEDERIGALEACFVIVEALQGLHAAHSQTDPWGKPANIIHRDVSPQNILLSYDGHVKVIDFGIARARDRLERTQAGTIKGKLRYLAPEMIDPLRFSPKGDFDHRVDVFAAGIILYELVAGRTLFTGADEIAVYDHITKGEIPDLSLEKLCDPPLMRIIRRALERSPEQRYPTADAFADELRAYLYRRDPAFTPKRLAAVLERYFGDEKAQRQALEEPDPALDEERELNLTRTAQTPSSVARGAEAGAVFADGAVKSSPGSQKSSTSVSRRSPKQKRTGEVPHVDAKYTAPPNAETKVADPGLFGFVENSETEADPRLADDARLSSETSTNAPIEKARGPSSQPTTTTAKEEKHGAEPPPAVRVEARSDPARPARPPLPTVRARAPRGPAVALGLSVVVGLALAIVVVVALESGADDDVQVIEMPVGTPPTKPPEPVPDAADLVPLVIAATPDSASIELVGRPDAKSRSPALFMVSPGEPVEVRVSAAGYEARRERLEVEQGKDQLRLSVDLVALPVALTVEVEPKGASVTVDGARYRAGMEVAPGKLVVVAARAEGFLPRDERVTPVVGQPLHVALALEGASGEAPDKGHRSPVTAKATPRPAAAKGELTITSTPYWGRVTIDGKTLEDTTPVTVKLKPGEHTVEVSHPPKGIVERFTIKIEAGEKLRRTVKFTK